MSEPGRSPSGDHATRASAAGLALWTGSWAPARRIAVFVAGCLQLFLHAGFFRMVLVPGYKWPEPVEPHLFWLTEGTALATSLGLLALPFVKTPRRKTQVLLVASLTLGVLANAYRMLSGVYMGDFWFFLVCDFQHRGILCGDPLGRLITDVGIHVMFGALLYLNLFFLWRLRRVKARGAPS